MARLVVGKLFEATIVDGVPLMVDDALWVVTPRWGRGFIDGNTHSLRGGFGVWYPDHQFGHAVLLSEVMEMSEASKAWIAGYLFGVEPTVEEYLGFDDFTDAEWRRWRHFCDRWHKTGEVLRFRRRPTWPIVLTEDERSEFRAPLWTPWAVAGERVWVPDIDSWSEATPQPDLTGEDLRPGTPCADNGYHDWIYLDCGFDVCIDCCLAEPSTLRTGPDPDPPLDDGRAE